ncbi:MAG: glutathione S-transferase C-terminal domain-containing protein [Spirochaetaceae bacterium]|jgi:putative glutathione S-transferase|nr:glutathione S-transferase C-terminal domain-containing protein [Spirochaetaceae bacterium]
MAHENEASPADFDGYGTIYHPKGLSAAPSHLRANHQNAYPFRGRIEPRGEFPPEAGRYHLYVSYACPFAHRTLIVRALKGLEDAVSVSVLDPIRDGRGWAFRNGSGQTLDTAGNGFTFLSQAYEASSTGYEGRVSVPVLWDKVRKTVVSNYYPTITIDLGAQFNQWATHPGLDLYPEPLRREIDELNDFVAYGINEGVYRAGFADSQAAYDTAVEEVFAALDTLEKRLSDGRPCLFGEHLRETDIRLWVTLVRFDLVYFSHFKVNLRQLRDYPFLWAYARRLYTREAFASTTNFDHIKRHYFGTQLFINPRGIVPRGPLQDWHI